MSKATESLDLHPWMRTLSVILSIGFMLVGVTLYVNNTKAVADTNTDRIIALTKRVDKGNEELAEKVSLNKDNISAIKTDVGITKYTVERIEKNQDSIERKLDKVLEK